MSTQIAVRLPDRVVEFLDHAVSEGRATSRAALVTSALEREMRRLLAEHDVEILRGSRPADDLDELATWTARTAELDD
jgi:Arc/MetJ-type ribon-helix-helix transcriptional regulator